MTAELIPIQPQADIDALITVALATCPSPETHRSYGNQLRKFIASGQPLTREGVALFLAAEREAGKGFATIQNALSAIRKLAAEAHVRGLLPDVEHYGIGQLKPGKRHRTRRGMWLTVEQVEKLLELPDRSTYLGKRDAAMLSLMVGCGLRREEIETLRWDHIQEREGRPCIVDLKGKGGRERTLPLPTWTVTDLDAWRAVSQGKTRRLITIDEGVVGPGLTGSYVYDADRILQGISANYVWRLVTRYGERLGVDIAPHDLRRTLAQLLRRAKAPLEQIQHTLGHASIATTQVYLGTAMELRRGAAAVDQIRLRKPQG